MTNLKVGAHIEQGSPTDDIDLSTPAEEIETAPVVENIPTEVPLEEPSVEPEIEPSSLTPEIEPSQEEVIEKRELEESDVLSFVSEKLGRTVTSLDELNQIPQENPLEKDSYLNELYEWRKRTNRPIEDFVKYQKDYGKLSDLEVAREFLQHEYPNFTSDEIDAELKSFIPDDTDLDDEASTKIRNLKKYSTQGRNTLKEFNSNLNNPLEANFSPEIKEDLSIAAQYKEILASNQETAKQYYTDIKTSSQSVESIKLDLTDDLSIDFKVSPETKNQLPDMIDQMPHWKNQDGSWNHNAIVQDAIKIKHNSDMIRLAYEQGLNAGLDNATRQSNNITLEQPRSADSSQVSKKGVEIEGIDDFISGSRLKIGK